jgi:hypothetical protein
MKMTEARTKSEQKANEKAAPDDRCHTNKAKSSARIVCQTNEGFQYLLEMTTTPSIFPKRSRRVATAFNTQKLIKTNRRKKKEINFDLKSI